MPPQFTRQDFLALFERERAEVTVADGQIWIFLAGAAPYHVALDEIQCERDIMEAVTHLFESTRADTASIRDFIHHAHGHLRRRRAALAPLAGTVPAMLAHN